MSAQQRLLQRKATAAQGARNPGRSALAAAVFLAASALPFAAAADTLSHTFVNAPSATSPSLGPDFTTGWRNLYPSGGTFVTATEAENSGLPEHDRFRLVQEFDNPRTGVERFEAAVGVNSWSATMPYLASYVSVDYYAGSIARFGFDGPSRRFDLAARYGQTARGHLIEVSPTYTLPLDARGRTSAWLSVTLDGPVGYTAERYGGAGVGVSRQLTRRLRLAVSATGLRERNATGLLSTALDFGATMRVSPW